MLVGRVIAVCARRGDVDFGRRRRLGASSLGGFNNHGETLASGRGDAFGRAFTVEGFVSGRGRGAKDGHIGDGGRQMAQCVGLQGVPVNTQGGVCDSSSCPYSPMPTAMQGSLQGGSRAPWSVVKDGKWAKGVARCCWTTRLEERPKTAGEKGSRSTATPDLVSSMRTLEALTCMASCWTRVRAHGMSFNHALDAECGMGSCWKETSCGHGSREKWRVACPWWSA